MNGEGDIKMDFLVPEKEKWYLLRQLARLGTRSPDKKRCLTHFFKQLILGLSSISNPIGSACDVTLRLVSVCIHGHDRSRYAREELIRQGKWNGVEAV